MDRLTKTANNTGFDMGVPSYKVEAWVDAYDGVLPLVDVGSGYGTNALVALKRGAKVVAIDTTEEHLQKIRSRAAGLEVGGGQLTALVGKLPDDVTGLQDNGASGILCAQVLHFLNPQAVKQSFHHFYRWLKAGGKLVVLATSHYSGVVALDRMTELSSLSSSIEDSWPGCQALKEEEETSPLRQVWLDSMPPEFYHAIPDFFQTFWPTQFRRAAESAGFIVDECELAAGSLSNYPPWGISKHPQEEYRNNEMVVLMASKPAGES